MRRRLDRNRLAVDHECAAAARAVPSRPPGPDRTSPRSSEVETIVKTISRLPVGEALGRTFTPWAPSGSAGPSAVPGQHFSRHGPGALPSHSHAPGSEIHRVSCRFPPLCSCREFLFSSIRQPVALLELLLQTRRNAASRRRRKRDDRRTAPGSRWPHHDRIPSAPRSRRLL